VKIKLRTGPIFLMSLFFAQSATKMCDYFSNGCSRVELSWNSTKLLTIVTGRLIFLNLETDGQDGCRIEHNFQVQFARLHVSGLIFQFD